jgi:23S rRNA pseudouridine1911/1915/1917 synthase
VALPPRRHFLHAAWLRFQHPVSGAAIDLRAPLPADLTLSLKTVDGSGTLPADTDLLEYFGFYRDDG